MAGLGHVVKKLHAKGASENAQRLVAAAAGLDNGGTAAAFAALQGLRPYVAAGGHPDARIVLMILDGTARIRQPHPALLVLLSVAIRPVLRP